VDFVRPDQISGEEEQVGTALPKSKDVKDLPLPELSQKKSSDVLETSFGGHSSHHFTPTRSQI
jgi:hypothetical protein